MRDYPWFNEKAIGRRLGEARGNRSQRELGELLGYLQPQISRYERGEIPGSFRFLAGLASFFGVNLNWLLTGRGSPRLAEVGLDPDRARGAPSVEGPLVDALRGFVLQVVRESPEAPSAIPEDGAGLSFSPTVSLPNPWDSLQIELPFLLRPLLASGKAQSHVAIPAGAEGDASDGAQPMELLASLRRAAQAGDIGALLAQLVGEAQALEERDPSLPAFERARFLLLWAWVLAESQEARATSVSPSASSILFRLARATRKTGRLEEAERIYLASRSRAAEVGEAEVVARSHAGLGNLYLERGEFERARREYVSLLEEALRQGNPRLLFRAYLNLSAYYHEHEGAYEKAAEYARLGLVIARREMDLEHVGRFLNELGLNEMGLRNLENAETCFEEALEIAADVESPLLLASGKINLGELRLRVGAHEDAFRLLREGREAAHRAGLVWAECQAEILLARAEHAVGRTANALARLEKVQERCAEHGLSHEQNLARSAEREIRRAMLGKIEDLSA